MSAGLLGQALMGGLGAMGQGMGDKIRADAAKKRKEALMDKRQDNQLEVIDVQDQNARERSETQHGRQQARDEQQQQWAQENTKLSNDYAEGRLELADEMANDTYEDVSDEGGNIIGRRNTETNKFEPFTTSGSNSSASVFGSGLNEEDWKRLKYVHEVKNDRLTALREMSQDPAMVMDKKQTEEMMRLTDEVKGLEDIVYGNQQGGGTTLMNLLNPEPGQDQQPAPEEAGPQTVGGLIQSGMKQQEEAKAEKNRVSTMEQEAESALNLLNVRPTSGQMGRAAKRSGSGVSPENLAKAKAVRDKYNAMSVTELQTLSDRQQSKIIGIITELNRKLAEHE